jgi:hypothetical protein
MGEDFQTAFPEDQAAEDGVLCRYGCGQPAKFGNLRGGVEGGDPPRCSGKMSDCPVVKGTALRAAKKAGRLGHRWQSRF